MVCNFCSLQNVDSDILFALCHHVVRYVVINISEKPAASVFDPPGLDGHFTLKMMV